jgi:hypothetical protein
VGLELVLISFLLHRLIRMGSYQGNWVRGKMRLELNRGKWFLSGIHKDIPSSQLLAGSGPLQVNAIYVGLLLFYK